ncbi:MAG: cupin domain-containing protein, partial [Nitrospira sp.]|nr:cupin domain-containing protein [Nitrospira sp.]
GARMEILSEVLRAVKLDGAMFYNAEFSAPWCARSIDARTVTSYLSPNSQHVIIFHLLTEGRGYAHVEGDDRPVPLNAGDILIVPRGDSHILGNGPSVTPVDRAQVLEQVLSQGLKVSRMGGGGGTHQVHLRLHVLRSAAQQSFPWRAAAHHKSQHPRRRVGPMAGKLHPLFGGQCGCVQARW